MSENNCTYPNCKCPFDMGADNKCAKRLQKVTNQQLYAEEHKEQLKQSAKNPLEQQIGGSHYKDLAIQPVEFIEQNDLSFLEGCVIKRLCRHDKPTGKGKQDIQKAIHELQLLLQLRYGESQ